MLKRAEVLQRLAVPAKSSRGQMLFYELMLHHEACDDYLTCTDLLSLIQRRKRLPEADAQRIFAKLVLAVKLAHDQGVAVRSIKPDVV